MKCYFCQTELEPDPHWLAQKGGPNWEYCKDSPSFDYCKNCEKLHSVKVHTMNGLKDREDGSYHLIDDGELMYVHIYIDERKFLTVPGPAVFAFRSSTLVFGHNYHYRLHLREGFTNLGDPTDSDPNDLVVIPGFPITPSNARESLRRYLVSVKATEIDEL